MNPLVSKFNNPIPSWFGGIREEAFSKITCLPLVQACSKGEIGAIEALVLGFWPFILVFPDQIQAATHSMIRAKYLTLEQRVHSHDLWALTSDLLPSIRQDEENHRALWIETAKAIGISIDQLAQVKPTPEMLALVNLTGGKVHPTQKLLQFATVEIVAESLSKTVLASSLFREKVGKGEGWFRVHAEHHSEDTHETLTLRLALALHRDVATPTEVNQIVQLTADTFVNAANACFSEVYYVA